MWRLLQIVVEQQPLLAEKILNTFCFLEEEIGYFYRIKPGAAGGG